QQRLWRSLCCHYTTEASYLIVGPGRYPYDRVPPPSSTLKRRSRSGPWSLCIGASFQVTLAEKTTPAAEGRFERPTPRFVIWRSILLSYSAIPGPRLDEVEAAAGGGCSGRNNSVVRAGAGAKCLGTTGEPAPPVFFPAGATWALP